MVDGPWGSNSPRPRFKFTAAWASSKKPVPPNIIAIPRIAPIYEGTNGIQSRDLMGRKVLRDGGETARGYIEEMRKYAAAAAMLDAPYSIIGENLSKAIDALANTTDWLVEHGGKSPALAFAGRTPILIYLARRQAVR